MDELLRYATYISRTTVPPTFRRQDVKLPAVAVKQEKGEDGKPLLTNGTSTPPPTDTQGEGVKQEDKDATDESTGMRSMKPENKIWLEQQLPFEPWPAHPLIKQGALGDIQRMVEAGQDPASVLSAEERAEVERLRLEEEEREKEARAEADWRRMSMYGGGGGRRRAPVDDVFNPDDI